MPAAKKFAGFVSRPIQRPGTEDGHACFADATNDVRAETAKALSLPGLKKPFRPHLLHFKRCFPRQRSPGALGVALQPVEERGEIERVWRMSGPPPKLEADHEIAAERWP